MVAASKAATGGGAMAISKDRVAQYVLDYFHRDWQDADLGTNLRKDLKLDEYELHSRAVSEMQDNPGHCQSDL